MLVGRGLRVVALDELMLALDHPRIRVGEIDLPGRHRRREVGLGDRVRSEPAAAAVLAARPIALIGLLSTQPGKQLLIHAPLSFPSALDAVTRDRRGLLGTLIIQPAPSNLKPRLATTRGRQ